MYSYINGEILSLTFGICPPCLNVIFFKKKYLHKVLNINTSDDKQTDLFQTIHTLLLFFFLHEYLQK